MTSMATLHRAVATRRGHRVVPERGRAWPSIAAERHAGYDGTDDGGPGVPDDEVSATGADAGTTRSRDEAPFGLPVLAEVPCLASVLTHLRGADGAMLAAVAELSDLLASDEVERTTGVGIDHWLAAVAAQTRMDRRLLVRTCRLLHRLPTLDAAVRSRRVSFAQLRGLSLALRRAPVELDDAVDRLLGALLDGLDRLERPDPDALVRQVDDAIDELRAAELAERERDVTADRYLSIQPFLDGTGGRYHGQLDAAGLALLDAASTPPDALLDHPGGYGAARADTLLARLAADHTGETDDPAATHGTGLADAAEPGAVDVPGDLADLAADDGHGAAWWDRLAAPKLLVRLPFEALLDDAVPADLLTRLLGGRLRLTSPAARRFLDERGAQLRTVVIDDDGAVIGVGRGSRQPPGWVSDVLAAVHDTCTGPGCDRPARGADADHAIPWWPKHPGDPAGTTDVDNLGPLCPTTNRAKEAAGWLVTQTGAGVRTWHHPRSGLSTTTVPATWRPPDDPRRRRRPPRPVPPGLDRPGAVAPDRDPTAPPPDSRDDTTGGPSDAGFPF